MTTDIKEIYILLLSSRVVDSTTIRVHEHRWTTRYTLKTSAELPFKKDICILNNRIAIGAFRTSK